MSLIEILRVLYDDIMNHQPSAPNWPERDRCILSKGHGCLALYSLLADHGYFPVEELGRFCRAEGKLGGHPEYGKIPGIEASTGSLGHGLSIGLGMALAARIRAMPYRVFVVLGDGEINEGSVWEAAMSAGKHQLTNLVALIDYNKFQSYGRTDVIQPLEPLEDKWRSFGFGILTVDGHDLNALRFALGTVPAKAKKPTAIICHTVKGKGIPFAENNPTWHHKSNLSESEIADLYRGLEPD